MRAQLAAIWTLLLTQILFGGLTVLQQIAHLLPHERLVYLGDTARCPYGTKSHDIVAQYACENSDFLVERGIKMLVVACNTVSAVALEALRERYEMPVIGVIEPGAEAAVAAAPAGRIAVIATEGTVAGGAYVRAIHARNPSASVTQQACPLFVALAEEGLTEGPIAEGIAARYLEPLLRNAARPECLVLGCTHFPPLSATIARVAGAGVKLVDSADTTAASVAKLLEANGLARTGAAAAPPKFLATDAPERFARVGEIFLGKKIDARSVELVDLPR
ncbi:MAG: glutamate racemase [Proteobacteria bacterium]|nr:glutamate racemase [Pseudomonadota bacterium]